MEIAVIVLALLCAVLGLAVVQARRRNGYLFNQLVAEQNNNGALQDNLRERISNTELMYLLHDTIKLLYDDDAASIAINTEKALLSSKGRVYLITTAGIAETEEWAILRNKPVRIKRPTK